MKIIYIAGAYRGDVHRNIALAEQVAIDLAEMRIGFFCPHTHTAHFDSKTTAPEVFYIALGLEMLDRCDALLLLPDWLDSEGARGERIHAVHRGMPIFDWPQDRVSLGAWVRRPPDVQ